MKNRIFALGLTFCLALSVAQAEDLWITLGADAQDDFTSMFASSLVEQPISENGVSAVKVPNEAIPYLSRLMHGKFKRCGGFFVHESKEEAVNTIAAHHSDNLISHSFLADYSIDQNDRVEQMLPLLDQANIAETIKKLSSYHNRYYESQTGKDALVYIRDRWLELASGRSDVKVEFFDHSWKQPSVVLTIEGATKPDEVVVLGGHADSIAGFFRREKAKAPGADDNASGISTLTEVLRVAMDSSYSPGRTVKFMAYAAEEVGLRGSSAIANKFKQDAINVVGVMQLDMTNYQGTRDKELYLVSDFTDATQNAYMGKLIDAYVKLPWGYTKCGYACSDHASWTKNGFPASFPFESSFNSYNRKIHTANDTIDVSGGHAEHALKFSKLALAYMIEMAK